MHRPYTMFKRKMIHGAIFYVMFRDYQGKRMTAVSSEQTSRAAAEAWALAQIEGGKVPASSAGNITLKQFSANFFVWGKCDYIKRRLAEGKSIGRTYAEGRRKYIETYILPTFGKMKLSEITRPAVEKWRMKLLDDGLAAGTVNSILTVLKLMLREARDAELIPRNPAEAVGMFKAKPAERGILTNAEVKKLFAEKTIAKLWAGDRRMFTAHLVLASTGLRLGELQALQMGDVQKDHLAVVHAWERKAGLKAPKWDSARVVPLPSKTALYLREIIEASRFKDDPASLVFYGRTAYTPMAQSFISAGLHDALAAMKIPETERRRRGIVVHSWRRWFNTMLRSGGVEDSKIRALTGHKSPAMTDRYTSFGDEHFKDALAVAEGRI